MTIRELLSGRDTVTVADVVKARSCSRQYAQRLLSLAVDAGEAVRLETRPGMTATYRRVDHTPTAETAVSLPIPPELPPGVDGVRGALRNTADAADVIERRVRQTGVVTDRDVAAVEWMAAQLLRVVAQARAVAAGELIAA